MIERTRDADLALFYEVSDEPRPAKADDVPLRIAVPAFIVSELHTAFEMGLAYSRERVLAAILLHDESTYHWESSVPNISRLPLL